MKMIVVCYKWVRDDADIRTTPSRALDMEKAGFKISEYDKNTIEAGVRLKTDADAVTLVGVTCGPNCSASTKDALSRGLDAVHYCEAVQANADNRATARTLSAMIEQLGDVDVVLYSEGSADEYAQQTAPCLATLLDWPCVTYAEKIVTCGDKLRISRALEDGVETVELPLPVVISAVPAICEAPIPSVKAILGAKRKPATESPSPDTGLLEPLLVEISTFAPKVNRKHQRLNPDGVSLEEAASNLKKLLTADSVL